MTDSHTRYSNKHYDDKVEEIMTNSELKAEVERLSELVRIRSFANNEMVSQLQSERAKSLKYREALDKIAILGAGSNAYTSAFTEQVNQIARRALEELEKK